MSNFTRRHYQTLADALGGVRVEYREEEDCEYVNWDALLIVLSNALEKDNGRFDRKAFRSWIDARRKNLAGNLPRG